MSGAKPILTRKRCAALSLPERADLAALERLRPLLRMPVVERVGQLGNLADEIPLLALSAGVAAIGALTRNPRLARTGGRMLAAELMAMAFKGYGKDHIDRTRPDALLDKRRYAMRRGHSKDAALRAFPSGHTAGAIALAGAVAREYPVAPQAYAAAGTLGALQVARRAHFPGDVVAGAVLGGLAEAITAALFRASSRLSGERR